ncbi:MAG: exodeoxyribonuclease subunit beta, partial [Verrucomicrobiota bacterium]
KTPPAPTHTPPAPPPTPRPPHPDPPPSNELAVVLRASQTLPEGPRAVRSLLANALSAFDLAPISTLHGFCQSLIARHSLELGCDASLEITPDCPELLEQLVNDQLLLLSDTPGLEPDLARNAASLVTRFPDHTLLLPDPDPSLPSPEALTRAIHEAAERLDLSAVPKTSRKAIEKTLQQFRQDSLQKSFSDAQLKHLPEAFLKLWDLYPQIQTRRVREITSRLVQSVKTQFAHRKRAAGLRTFDDLLLTVRDALLAQGAEGPLACAVRKRLRAAIIDECQDSDGVQIQVFDRLFHHPHTFAFLVIGDPKQSIYRFRGADLASYKLLTAAPGVQRAAPMRVNYRSDSPLVDTLNRLYGDAYQFPDQLSKDHPTYYQPVSAKAASSRILDPAQLPSVVLQWTPSSVKGRAKTDLCRLLARECARLLGDSVQIADRTTHALRPLRAGDIAVLAHKHSDLQKVRRALAREGIRSQASAQGLGSVFGSDEARDVLAWLELLEALDRREWVLPRLLAFLATPLGGYPVEALLALRNHPAEQADLCARWMEVGASLARSGPLPLLLHQMADPAIQAVNLSGPDGERRYTNWQHVGCLLQHEHSQGKSGVHSLRRWLARQIAQPDQAPQDPNAPNALMRIETDADALHLVTIYGSKGLEYPVVFAPFLWSQRAPESSSATGATLVRKASGWEIDVGSDAFESHQKLAQEQIQEEEARILYVALTRPRHRLYLGLAPLESRNSASAADSEIARLLGLDSVPLSEWASTASRLPHLGFQTEESSFAPGASRSAASTPERKPRETPPLLAPSSEVRFPFPIQRTHSFSSLSKSGEDPLSAADHDAQTAVAAPLPAPPVPAPDLLAPLKTAGALLGDTLHSILEEHLGNRRPLAEAVGDRPMAAEWLSLLPTLLQTPIPLPGSPPIRLEALRAQCITEMQFHLPAAHFTPENLGEALLLPGDSAARIQWARQVGAWGFGQFSGFVQGYIDLLFEHEGRWFVADYKSNRLSHYAPNALEAAMLEKHYLLQARLYALALHRHLQHHLPDYRFDKHFGGVAYLFVRGFPSEGLWFERPPLPALQRLETLFCPTP